MTFHPLTVADVEFCVWGDDAFLQGGQCYYRLKSRARRETACKRQLLINDAEHTSSIGVHDDQAAVPVAQSRKSRLAHGGIVADRVVFRRRFAERAETIAGVTSQMAPVASATGCRSGCVSSCFLAVWSLEAEGFLGEDRAREGAVEDGVREFSATPERVFIPNRKKAATARMASLLRKVVIMTSLV